MTKQEMKDMVQDLVAEMMCDIDYEDIFKSFIMVKVESYFNKHDIEDEVRQNIDMNCYGGLEFEIEEAIDRAVQNEIETMLSDLPF